MSETAGVPHPVFMFEGDAVVDMEGRLPAITMEMPEGYARGTHLRLDIEVRVKNARYEENRKGDLVRQHVFALESVQLVSSSRQRTLWTALAGLRVPTRHSPSRTLRSLAWRSDARLRSGEGQPTSLGCSART